jgi:prephenate dehydrogenase
MTVQFTFIGLGQIGTSFGLSLASHTDQIKRVGYDRVLEIQNKAKKIGAFDAVQYNLHDVVENADVVVLCLPLDQIEETLKQIGPDLREDAVVMDTAPVKAPVAEWFKTHIQPGRHYVGLIPALNPLYLGESERGIETAQADLFERGTIGIAAPAGTPEAAINLAANFVRMTGAQPLFLDMLEVDGMMAAAHLLPQLSAAALLNATVGQAGWSEVRRLAGRSYVLATETIAEDGMEALALAARFNRENTLHALEMMIGGLTGIHKALKEADDKDLSWRLKRAADDRLAWAAERQKADWSSSDKKDVEPWKIPNPMERLLGGLVKKKK